MGSMFKFLNGKIEKKQGLIMCNTLHQQIKEELARGTKQFEKIDKKLENQTTSLSDISTQIALLRRDMNNGQTN